MTKPWTFKEGTLVTLALVILGLLLQFTIGPIDWSLIAWPVNIILLVIYIALLFLVYSFHRKVYVFQWTMTYMAAVPALVIGALSTMLYGLTNWEGTLSCWPFVLLYFWIATILGLTSIKQAFKIVTKKYESSHLGSLIGAFICHLGLFISIVCATIGHADMQRLNLVSYEGEAEWRAFDNKTRRVHELDLAVQLNKFTLEEYPAHGDMPPMPSRFASDVTVFTKDGQKINTVIEVNKPLEVNGWDIYQYSYDTAAGKESKVSIFELVRDPWLPIVFVGIYMLIAGAVIMIMSRWNRRWFWTFIPFVALIAGVAYIFNEHEKTKELMPALQSPWFAPHVGIYICCYTILGIATILAIINLCLHSRLSSHPLWGMKSQTILVYIGSSLMTIGMLFGAIWAKEAWGHYWAWDPKETWAAATWFFYLTYIHFRITRPSKHKTANWLLILSFICLQMCWWGINYLPSAQENSVHTYNIR